MSRLQQWCREDRAIAAAPGDHDVDARLQRVSYWLGAHDGHDAVGAVERRGVRVGAAVEAADRGARAETAPDLVDRNLRVDGGQVERGEPVLPRDVAHQ